MSRLWSCGFELGSAGLGIEYAAVLGPVQVGTVGDGNLVRSGLYSGRIQSLTSGQVQAFSQRFLYTNGDGPYYSRICFIIDTLPSAKTSIMAFTAVDFSYHLWLSIDNTGQVTLEDNTTVFLTIPPQPLLRWAGIQLAYWRLANLGLNVYAFQGIGDTGESLGPLQTYTSTLTSTGIYSVSCGGNLRAEAVTGGKWYIDDVCINDTAGIYENFWPGNGHIVHHDISGAGDATFMGTQGVDFETRPTPSLTPYTMVDDPVGPDDATTEIVFTTKSTGPTAAPYLFFATQSAATAGIPPNADIKLASVGVRVRSG